MREAGSKGSPGRKDHRNPPVAAERVKRRLAWSITVLMLLTGLVAGGLVAHQLPQPPLVSGLGSTFQRFAHHLGIGGSDKDTDSDGLTDAQETGGWPTKGGHIFRTNPKNPDSDGDGLSDGVEAGELIRTTKAGDVYAGVSNPGRPDTDGDGVKDADEYLLDMNPRQRDTDRDGLADAAELDCGAEPTGANPDGDTYSDAEECARGSDPLAYDLDREEAVAAFLGGVTFGDWQWGATHTAHLDAAQLQAPEYLAGQVAGDMLDVSAARDLVASIGKRDLIGIVLAAIGVIPLAGGAAKAAKTLTTFARRGGRAEASAAAVAERMPWSQSLRKRVLKWIFASSHAALPKELEGGERDYAVYKSRRSTDSEPYVGITRDFARRKAQHAKAGRAFAPEVIKGASGLTRGEARAIEEACIVQGGLRAANGALANEIHSISPTQPYYAAAVAAGKALLKKGGGTCPV